MWISDRWMYRMLVTEVTPLSCVCGATIVTNLGRWPQYLSCVPAEKKESGCASNFHSEWFAHIQICWLHSIGLFFISLFGGDSLVICRCHFTPTPYATSGCNTRIHARLICLVEQLFKRPAGGMKWMKLWMVEDIFLPPRILSRINNYWELGPV